MSHTHSSAISVKYRIEIPADHREQINWLVRGNPGPKSGGRILKHVRYLLKLGLNVEAEFKSKFLNCFGIIFLCNQIAIKS